MLSRDDLYTPIGHTPGFEEVDAHCVHSEFTVEGGLWLFQRPDK
jgi:hypothetical protein